LASQSRLVDPQISPTAKGRDKRAGLRTTGTRPLASRPLPITQCLPRSGRLTTACYPRVSCAHDARLAIRERHPWPKQCGKSLFQGILTGTVADIRNMEGAPCLTTTHLNPKVVEAYLKATRAEMKHYFAVPLGSIRSPESRSERSRRRLAMLWCKMPYLRRSSGITTGFRMDNRMGNGR
jgi:hypothetical protein